VITTLCRPCPNPNSPTGTPETSGMRYCKRLVLDGAARCPTHPGVQPHRDLGIPGSVLRAKSGLGGTVGPGTRYAG